MYIQNLKKLNDFKATLMKTSKIPLCEIDKNFIDEIVVKWDDVSEMSITVANRIMIDGEIVDNSLVYNAFKGKRQQLIISNPHMRFVITECNRNESSVKDSSGKRVKVFVKEIKLVSYESTIGQLILTEDIQRQLWNDGTDESLDISDGILNLFEQDNPNWKVKYVSEDAMKEFGKIEKEFDNLISYDSSFSNVYRGQVLWEKDFNIDPFSENIVINLKVMYSGVKTYSGEKIQDDTKYVHKLDNIYTGVRKIKAIYNKSEDGMYSINYQITLNDGIVLDKWYMFSYCDGLNLDISKILLTYTTGEEYEGQQIKYRVFEAGEYNWTEFLRANVSTAYGDLYFEFDTINKELSCYTKKEYGEHKGIQFSYDNFVQEINKIDALDNIVSKLYVYSNNCSIADVNMFGSCDYILNYSYFYNNDGMTEELMKAWDRYLAVIEGKNNEMYDLRLNVNTYNKKLVKLESERTAIDYDVRNLEIRRTSYIADNKNGQFDADIEKMSIEINKKKDKFEQLMIEIQKVKDDITELNGKIKEITVLMNIETSEDKDGKIFNDDLIEELRDITVEETVNDDTYLTSNGLYGRYLEIIEEKNTKGIDFTIDSKGFLDNIIIPKGVEWDFYIKMGDFVDLAEDDEIVVDDRGLRIVEYTLIPKDGQVEVKDIKLTNRDIQLEDYSGASSLKSDVSRANGYVNNYKSLWEESVTVSDFYNKVKNEGMDLRANSIRSRANRVKFDFTEAGLYIINNDEEIGEDMQIYCGAGMICFTDDRWLTCKTALDTTGLIAKNLIGEVILGEKLYIVSENGEFYIGNQDENEGFGLSIKEGNNKRIFLGTEMVNGVRKARLRLMGKDNELVLSEDGIVSEFQYTDRSAVDSNTPMYSYFRIQDNVNILKECILMIKLRPFRVYSKGMEGGGAYVKGVSTLSGGGSTSSSGGGYSSSVTSTNQNYVTFMAEFTTNLQVEQTGNNHVHPISKFQFDHDHVTNIYISPHTHQNYDHTHTTNIDIPNHVHLEKYGCYDLTGSDNIPSNVVLKVNGVEVRKGINDDTEINISSYLNIGQVNEITLESETRGHIYINLYSKSFVTW